MAGQHPIDTIDTMHTLVINGFFFSGQIKHSSAGADSSVEGRAVDRVMSWARLEPEQCSLAGLFGREISQEPLR